MTLELELGQCYVRKDGNITGPLEYNDTFIDPELIELNLRKRYLFRDPKYLSTYTFEGKVLVDAIEPTAEDLISEYKVKPSPDLIGISISPIWA